MSTLTWHEQLALGDEKLDGDHRALLEGLAQLNAQIEAGAPVAQALTLFDAIIAATSTHFELEEQWMAASGFARDNCHSTQHAMVLRVLGEVREHVAQKAELTPLRSLIAELAAWLPAHVDMMDAALVYHLRQVGFDPATGQCSQALPAQALTSCGSGACG
ncbi:hemerythrin domain-containing protein [Paucibacter soli]|uniref:hemerythrin domain-containing protein n=1 Tax=Paucibacter soli TaxID=3133433 RepID=UPI0030B4725D